MTNGSPYGAYGGPNTLNMWSNVQNIWPFPCLDPYYVDLSVGYAYSFWIANTTDNDIDSGEIELFGADADPTDWCKPGLFTPLDPVAGCNAIVSGVAEPGPVKVTLGHDLVIRARSVCGFSAPCPRQFFQIKFAGGLTGVQAFAVVSSIRRTNWDHVSPWGYIPQPMDIGIESMMATLPPGGRAALPPGQAQAQQPQRAQPPAQPRAPQPQPAPQQPVSAQPAPGQRVPNPRPPSQPQPTR